MEVKSVAHPKREELAEWGQGAKKESVNNAQKANHSCQKT